MYQVRTWTSSCFFCPTSLKYFTTSRRRRRRRRRGGLGATFDKAKIAGTDKKMDSLRAATPPTNEIIRGEVEKTPRERERELTQHCLMACETINIFTRKGKSHMAPHIAISCPYRTWAVSIHADKECIRCNQWFKLLNSTLMGLSRILPFWDCPTQTWCLQQDWKVARTHVFWYFTAAYIGW